MTLAEIAKKNPIPKDCIKAMAEKAEIINGMIDAGLMPKPKQFNGCTHCGRPWREEKFYPPEEEEILMLVRNEGGLLHSYAGTKLHKFCLDLEKLGKLTRHFENDSHVCWKEEE